MFKSGFITIVGKPNVGKSTLINKLVGEKVAIVSWRPQTTRNKIIGIMNEPNYQAVFIDTPGIHSGKNNLSDYMMQTVNNALEGVDVVLYMIACDKIIDKKDEEFLNKYAKSKTPIIVVLNKCEIVQKEEIVKKIQFLDSINGIHSIIPISAKTGKNTEGIKEEIEKLLKEGELLYPEDMITDKTLRFMVSEIVREKALQLLEDEVPYGVGVSINLFEEQPNGYTKINADLICEKTAHKGIIIGKGGSKLKEISTKARLDIEKLLDCPVHLELYVRVKADWRESDLMLKQLGYDKKNIN